MHIAKQIKMKTNFIRTNDSRKKTVTEKNKRYKYNIRLCELKVVFRYVIKLN